MGKNNKSVDNSSVQVCKNCKHCRHIRRDTKVRDKFVALVNVKTIVTLALTAGFIWLTYLREVTADLFTNIFTMVIGYYFGTQLGKFETSGTDYSTYDKCATCPYHPSNQAAIQVETVSDAGVDPNDPNI